MTIGQVTFEAVKTSTSNWSADYARQMWEQMPEGERNSWETAGQAIEAFHETGLPGAR